MLSFRFFISESTKKASYFVEQKQNDFEGFFLSKVLTTAEHFEIPLYSAIPHSPPITHCCNTQDPTIQTDM